MERAAGFAYNNTLQTKLNNLDSLLTLTSTTIQDAGLLADMLLLPNYRRYPGLNLSAKQRRDRTLKALTEQIEALARLNPVLTIFEDAHWADPTSLELFDHIVNAIPSLRALLIVTFRSGFEPPWVGRPHMTALALN